jgi:hypothetical protein
MFRSSTVRWKLPDRSHECTHAATIVSYRVSFRLMLWPARHGFRAQWGENLSGSFSKELSRTTSRDASIRLTPLPRTIPKADRSDMSRRNRIQLDSRLTATVLSMRSFTHAMCLLTALIVVSGGTNASATPLSPFRYEAQAHRHCPADIVVWLDFEKGPITSNGRNATRRATPGASCAGTKPAATATAVRCLVFARQSANLGSRALERREITGSRE